MGPQSHTMSPNQSHTYRVLLIAATYTVMLPLFANSLSLEDRISRLERTVGDLPSKEDFATLKQELAELRAFVQQSANPSANRHGRTESATQQQVPESNLDSSTPVNTIQENLDLLLSSDTMPPGKLEVVLIDIL